MHTFSLEDRIRELCIKAAATNDSDQLSPILAELRAALHEQYTLTRELMAEHTRMRHPKVY
jgi:hypothetical protein